MRACSRCTGCATSEVFGGSGRLTCVVPMRPRSAQPTSNANSAGAISRRAGNPDTRIARLTTSALSVPSPLRNDLFPKTGPHPRSGSRTCFSGSLRHLYLLGTRRLHPGAAPLFDPSAYPHALACKRLRLETGGRESALVALGDGDREILRPAPPEIHVNGAS